MFGRVSFQLAIKLCKTSFQLVYPKGKYRQLPVFHKQDTILFYEQVTIMMIVLL